MADPRFFIQTVATLLGLIVGSFLNVCIFRLPRNCLSIVKPRSRCPKCLAPIGWYDNLPVASYIVLGGKCRYCKERINIRYPLVELLTAFLFALVAYRFLFLPPYNLTLTQAVVAALIHVSVIGAMIVVTFIDWEFRIIPDEITIPGVILAVILVALFPFAAINIRTNGISWIADPHLAALAFALIGAVAGMAIVYGVGIVGKVVFRKEAMGFGDVKYMAMLGAFVGWQGIIVAFFLSCFIGSIFGIISWAITKDRYIAFGPYLSMGSGIVLLFGPEVFRGIALYQELIRGV